MRKDCEGWWLSGCRGSVAEHWQLKPEVSWVRLLATAGLFTFLYFHFITSILLILKQSKLDQKTWKLTLDIKLAINQNLQFCVYVLILLLNILIFLPFQKLGLVHPKTVVSWWEQSCWDCWLSLLHQQNCSVVWSRREWHWCTGLPSISALYLWKSV